MYFRSLEAILFCNIIIIAIYMYSIIYNWTWYFCLPDPSQGTKIISNTVTIYLLFQVINQLRFWPFLLGQSAFLHLFV